MWPRRVALACVLLALVTASAVACTRSGSGGGLKVVASFYPLAWAAEQVGGSRVDVLDLTPPGGEAHDATLTARQRADLQDAKVVLILGYFGFQPQIEDAARDATGIVVPVARDMQLHGSGETEIRYDPHVWLDPVLMERIIQEAAAALERADPAGATAYRENATSAVSDLAALDGDYASGLATCRHRTFVVTHLAFGYLAGRYGLTQIGIQGIAPESEPTANQVETALAAIRSGRAAPAVFFEATGEGRAIGESVAGDAGVPALPLNTLEAAPSSGGYMGIMRANLAELEKGLACSA